MLSRHRLLNSRFFVRYAADIARYHKLTTASQVMIDNAMAHTAVYKAVVIEQEKISDRLGFLVDAEHFYRKLDGLTGVMKKGLRKLGQLSH
jgi:hypothetical protein